jgi:hypothetical protein
MCILTVYDKLLPHYPIIVSPNREDTLLERLVWITDRASMPEEMRTPVGHGSASTSQASSSASSIATPRWANHHFPVPIRGWDWEPYPTILALTEDNFHVRTLHRSTLRSVL